MAVSGDDPYSACFTQAPQRRSTGSLKWDRHPDPSLLPLWVADMDFQSPPEVIEALRNRVEHGVFGYALPREGLGALVQSRMKERYGADMDPLSLIWTPGLVPAIHAVCRARAIHTKRVLVPTPIYPPFLDAPERAGAETVRIPFQDTGSDWVPDLEALEREAKVGADVLLLCNPHNPLGRVYREHELQRIVELCDTHDLVLCSDEVHCDLILDTLPHVSLERLTGLDPKRRVTLMGATKTFNIAGLACAWMSVPDADLRHDLKDALHGIAGEINPMGFTATQAALEHGEPWRTRCIDVLRERRNHVETFLREECPGIQSRHVEATYLAWLDVRPLKLDNPCASLQKKGLWLSDGKDFGAPGFLRLNFGCSESTLASALKILKAWHDEHACSYPQGY